MFIAGSVYVLLYLPARFARLPERGSLLSIRRVYVSYQGLDTKAVGMYSA